VSSSGIKFICVSSVHITGKVVVEANNQFPFDTMSSLCRLTSSLLQISTLIMYFKYLLRPVGIKLNCNEPITKVSSWLVQQTTRMLIPKTLIIHRLGQSSPRRRTPDSTRLGCPPRQQGLWFAYRNGHRILPSQ
jgi:hypothetical protein